jgi:hypothetical protein
MLEHLRDWGGIVDQKIGPRSRLNQCDRHQSVTKSVKAFLIKYVIDLKIVNEHGL